MRRTKLNGKVRGRLPVVHDFGSHARVSRLTESVLPSLEENQRLSTVSFRSGEIGLLQLLLVNRQLLDGRRDYLDAVAEFSQTRIALEEAAGFVGKDNAR